MAAGAAAGSGVSTGAADGAGSAGNQHRCAFADVCEGNCMRGSHCGDAEACARIKANLFGQRDRLGRREHDKFGACAKRALPLAVPYPDPFADPRLRNSFTNFVDYAGTVAMRYDPWVGDFSRGALP